MFDPANAPRKNSLFADLPKLYLVLHLEYAVEAPQIPNNTATIVQKHQLVVQQSRVLELILTAPAPVLVKLTSQYLAVLALADAATHDQGQH